MDKTHSACGNENLMGQRAALKTKLREKDKALYRFQKQQYTLGGVEDNVVVVWCY